MDGRSGLVLLCAISGCAWALLGLAVLGGRLRARRRHLTPEVVGGDTEWRVPEEVLDKIGLGDAAANEEETRQILGRSLRSDDPAVRMASITALGRLAGRFEWAIDGLVEVLVGDADEAVKVATELDRLAPRPGPRLPPLLGHPSSTVRFYAVRLLAGYESLAARHLPAMIDDRSANVRAAALESLRDVASGETLRCALRLLDDPSPVVRAQAVRTASAVAPLPAASFVAPLLVDRSWWVRNAAREGLVAAGRDVADLLVPALESDDPALRAGAALVMQDIGLVDDLVTDVDPGQLERILDAGGGRLRRAASERARHGLHLAPGAPHVEPA